MIEIAIQQQHNGLLKPFAIEDSEALKNFKPNQILRAKITGIRKERSVRQNAMLHACIKCVADNTEDKQWDTPEKVKIQLKHALHFYKATVVLPDGSIHFELDSFAFKNLSQMDANKICDRSWLILAKKIGITTEILLANAERYS
jgi:hypothetical protein